MKEVPTAVQALAERHDTANRSVLVVPTGLGVARMRHVVPFHASASDRSPLPVRELPEAVQALAEVHDTPESPLPVPPAALGVAWMRQEVPFHRSAKVSKAEEPLV